MAQPTDTPTRYACHHLEHLTQKYMAVDYPANQRPSHRQAKARRSSPRMLSRDIKLAFSTIEQPATLYPFFIIT